MTYHFNDLTLDSERRELRRGDALVAVEPQVFDLLEFLIRARDRVVSRDEVLAAVWHGRIVSEATLSSRVNAARTAIGDNGEVVLELWCKGGKGQFSVAGNTVIFVPGQIQDRSCPPARAQADDDLVAALGSVETWKRQGDVLTLIGPKPLRFRVNGN